MWHNTILGGKKNLFILAHVLLYIIEGEEFDSHTKAHHQGVIKGFLLHFWGTLKLLIFSILGRLCVDIISHNHGRSGEL